MSHISSLSAHGMQKLARNPVIIATFMALSLAGCASKKGLPNNASDLGLAQTASTARTQRRFLPGLHRQCRRPHLLRHRLLLYPRRCPADA